MTETNLIKQKFKSTIRRGTGEAHLLQQNHPGIDFSGEIIKACIKNFSYDGQCEQSREIYLFELINLSGKINKIKKAILKALLKPQNDTWTLTQLFDLAKIFAREGDTEAKQAIYDGFVHNPIWRSDWAGTYQIMELDGLEGLKFIAEEFGKRLEKDPEDWQDDNLINQFQKENPQIDVWAELDAATTQNRFIKIYIDDVRRNIAQRNERVKPTLIYKNIVEEALLRPSRIWFINRDLNSAELNLIAQQLIVERKKANREKLLRVFTKHKFPLDKEFLFELACKDPVRNTRIVTMAADALSLFKGEDIRQFAIESITASKAPENFVIILASNYKSGDNLLLTKLAAESKDSHVLEWLVLKYKNIYWANETPECREPLEALYDKHTCGMCRKDIVEI